MKLIAGPWSPDQPAFGNPGLVRAENVIPAANHYLPFPQATSLGISGLSGQAEGMTVATPPTATSPVLFAAFGGRIWRIPGSSSAPVDVSQDIDYGYSMAVGDRWRWLQYGSLQLAASINAEVQQFDLTNLAGTFADLSGAPKAQFIAGIRDFVMLGDVDEAPDGRVRQRLRWHGFNASSGLPDPTEWTISLETRSDFNDVPDLGEMTGLTGGQFGIALFKHGIARIDFGGDLLFSIPVVDSNIGCEVPGSVVQYGAETYFWSDEGIFKTAGGPAVPVGTERVNRWLQDNFDLSQSDQVWAQPDYSKGIIVWLFPGAGDMRRGLIYRPAVDQFSNIPTLEVQSLGPTVSFGLDLDDEYEWPDLDTDPRNLDDPRLWVGGFLRLGAQTVDNYDDAGDLASFDGQPMNALLQWSELEPQEGGRSAATHALAFHDGGTATITIRSRERVADSLVTKGPFKVQGDGWFRMRACGRFHQPRLELTGTWATARGLDLRFASLGWR